jgi:plasmid stabilization system protein ParE
MRVRYSRRATNDLASIHAYLSERSLIGAANVMAAIYASIEFIRRNPRGAEKTDIPGVHGKFVGKYRFKVFYRVLERDTVIEIVHIRHTSRKPWLSNNGDPSSKPR